MAHTYNVETGAWIQDPKEGWVSSKVVSKNVDGDQATLVFEITAGEREGEKLTKTTSLSVLEGNEEDNDLPPLMNPPILEASDDLTSLSHLNEPAVLQAIKLRYAKREIYTYSGIVLIATNPFERMDYLYDPGLIQAYAGKRREDQDPHLFAIADTAYQAMVRDEKNQTIVVSGESGAGKTVSAKYIMRYFATVEDPNRPGKRKKSNQGETMSKTEEQILATNPIMEAFGNAKTTRNDNSSRFGKYIEIMFDKNVDIVGAKIRTYLLERSRLVYQPATERNYHIFYQLIAGCSEDERKQLGLLPVEEFEYMNQGGEPVIPHMDDAAEFKLTRDALGTIGVPELTQTRIWKVLAALLHLGNTKIEAVRTGSVLSGSEPSLAKACELLGVDAEEFAKWTTKKQLVMRNEKTISPLNQKQAIVVRDSIAKFIYSSLFDWLVETINNSLAPEEVRDKINSFIGVLDIYGFEHFKRNSFEQFCINYANEKLQQEFNQHVFKLEQEEYAREQINWAYIEFSDNRPCIDLIEGKMGILSLLDEESRLPAGSDDSFVNKLHSNYGAGKPKDFPYQKPRFGKTSFTVCHYAVDVTYDSEGFIEKNRDTVPDEHMELLKASTNPFLTEVLQAALSVRDKETPTPSKTAVPAPGPVRRAGAVGNRKPTLGGIFKSSLIDLMTTIGGTNVHYIRCIKPNEAKVAWKFEGPMVLSQLQACGVLETVKISCAGYPTRWTYEEFAARYYMLIPSDSWNAGSIRDVGLSILKKTIPEEGHPKDGQKDGKDKFQLGMSKIFFRAGMLAYLENMRTTRLNQCAVLIQKNMKKKYYRKRYLQARESILNCQAYTRGFLARRKVQEMLVVRAVVTIQRFWRGSRERKAFNKIRESVVKLQAVAKGFLCRKSISDRIVGNAARYIQRAWKSRKFLKAWRTYRKRTIYIQSVWRGKIARREYKKMREEARDLKQISYKLENKVVELTQAVGKLKQDNKALLEKVESFDNQVKTWRTKHANLENRNKELQMEANQAGIASARLSQMDEEMRSLQRQFEESTANMKRLQEEGKSLRESLNKRTSELDDFKNRDKEHENEKQTLRAQIQALEEQLEHAGPIPLEENGVVEKPAGGITNGIINFVSNKKPKRRSAEASRLEGEGIYRSSYTARPASMMPTSAPVRLRDLDVQFSPKFETAEYELHRILEEDDQLSDEVSNGLITNLKIPSINGQTPLHEKEVLYPAYLINVVTSEMWNNGFVKESERFLANVMHTIQQEVMSHEGDEAINQGVFWLSNVHEMLSFVFLAEDWYEIQKKDDYEYDRLLEIVKHDLESLEFNIYHTWMKTLKRRLQKMIVPAIIESQSLPGFVTNDGNRFLNKILQTTSTPQFSMDDLLSLLNKIYKAMKAYYIEESIIAQAVTELLKLVGVTAFNDLLMRRNFLSWKRGLQINYNITRIEEWCKSHDMPEGTLQLEHLMQATKLLQLKKATLSDIEIIQDICWMLSPNQIQKLLNQYLVADYEQPINGEIMKAVASRVTEKSDVLLLAAVDMDDSGPYEIAEPRQINALETYCPSYLTTPRLRRLADIVSAQAQARAEDERKKTEEKLVEKRPELEAVHE